MTDSNVKQLPNGDYVVTRQDERGRSYETHYALHPDRLGPPRLTHEQMMKETGVGPALEEWKRVERDLERVERIVSRFFIGNEKHRGKDITVTTDRHSSLSAVDIPVMEMFGVDWIEKLIAYRLKLLHACEEAKLSFVAAVAQLQPERLPPLIATRQPDRILVLEDSQ